MEFFLRSIVGLIIFIVGYNVSKMKYKRANRPIYRKCDDWIPVTKEAVPESDDDIIVTIQTAHDRMKVWTTSNVSYDRHGNPQHAGRKVLAWMPLPEPYEEK
jgi:hypothetical protein